jgi:hypothetical protein
MTALLLLIGPSLQEQGDAPPQAAVERRDYLAEGWAIEPRVLWTAFDNDLRIENDFGVGMDIGRFSWNHGGPVYLRTGVYAWETENEDDEAKKADVHVRQYLLGMGGSFEQGLLDLGFRLDTGAFTYSGGGTRDVGFMTQVGLGIGLIPNKHLKFEILPLLSFSHSDFNRGHQHSALHFSASAGLSLRF